MQRFALTGRLSADGRLAGCYVYLLLCLDDAVRARIGIAEDPAKRLSRLVPACPAPPEQLATVRVRSRQRAHQVELELRDALAPWHSHAEWHRIPLSDRAAFNAASRKTLQAMSEPGYPLAWTVTPVATLQRARQARAWSAIAV